MPSLCPHDLHHGVVIVPSSRMYRNARGFVDDDHIFIFVQDRYGQCGDGGFMSMQRMRYDISVLDNMLCCRYRLAVNSYSSTFYGIFLILLEH